MLELVNMLRNSIHPDVMIFTDIRAEYMGGKDIIHLTGTSAFGLFLVRISRRLPRPPA